MKYRDKDKDRYFTGIEKEVKKLLKPSRYRHTMGVAHTAACLAMRYGEDTDRAYLAGLLHDVAKHLDDKEMLKKAAEYGISVTEFDRAHPDMLHGAVGAKIAEHKFGVEDEEVLAAITDHTVGRAGMSLLEEIVFVADYIEIGRNKAPDLSHVRELAFTDLKECIRIILKNTVAYLKDTGEDIDGRIDDVIRYYGE